MITSCAPGPCPSSCRSPRRRCLPRPRRPRLRPHPTSQRTCGAGCTTDAVVVVVDTWQCINAPQGEIANRGAGHARAMHQSAHARGATGGARPSLCSVPPYALFPPYALAPPRPSNPPCAPAPTALPPHPALRSSSATPLAHGEGAPRHGVVTTHLVEGPRLLDRLEVGHVERDHDLRLRHRTFGALRHAVAGGQGPPPTRSSRLSRAREEGR